MGIGTLALQVVCCDFNPIVFAQYVHSSSQLCVLLFGPASCAESSGSLHGWLSSGNGNWTAGRLVVDAVSITLSRFVASTRQRRQRIVRSFRRHCSDGRRAIAAVAICRMDDTLSLGISCAAPRRLFGLTLVWQIPFHCTKRHDLLRLLFKTFQLVSSCSKFRRVFAMISFCPVESTSIRSRLGIHKYGWCVCVYG